MSRIKKYVSLKNLSSYRTLTTDNESASTYFKVLDLPSVLSGGKNGFLILGTPFLVPTTEVLVELIDVNGNTVFLQPIRNYEEGLARVVSIEIYEDTPPGPATLTILGHLSMTEDGAPVPDEWKDAYNVKWSKTVLISPSQVNTSKIRLYNRPSLAVSEIRRKQAVAVLTNATATGSRATSISSQQFVGQTLDPNLYVITLSGSIALDSNFNDQASFTASVTESINGTTLQTVYSSSIDTVVNASSFIATNGLIVSGAYIPFSSNVFSLSYVSSSTGNSETTRSYADIRLTDLTTFTGDVHRVKIYAKPSIGLGSYEQLSDTILEEVELTVTSSTDLIYPKKPIGIFDSDSSLNYWSAYSVTSSAYYNTSSVSS